MRILVYGSTYLTEIVVNHLLTKNDIELVGYIPSVKPSFQGYINLEQVKPTIHHDIKLSIQYDKLLKDTTNAYNLHTGLLPEYGGVNILLHTIVNGVKEQGLTFHRMDERIDSGPIVGKLIYPVGEDDTILSLYQRVCLFAPSFTYDMLRLLMSGVRVEYPSPTPTRHKRSEIPENYRGIYERSYHRITDWIDKQR